MGLYKHPEVLYILTNNYFFSEHLKNVDFFPFIPMFPIPFIFLFFPVHSYLKAEFSPLFFLQNFHHPQAISTEHSSSELMVSGTNVNRVDSPFLHLTMYTYPNPSMYFINP